MMALLEVDDICSAREVEALRGVSFVLEQRSRWPLWARPISRCLDQPAERGGSSPHRLGLELRHPENVPERQPQEQAT